MNPQSQATTGSSTSCYSPHRMDLSEADTGKRKELLRAQTRAKLASLSPEQRLREAAEVTRFVLASEIWRRAGTLLSFVSMTSEIDTASLNRQALASGKLLALPRVEGDRLSFRLVDSAEGARVRSSYGALEPAVDSPPLVNARAPILVLVPGLAFDRSGHRLGRGRGFYDRFLASLAGAVTVGLCFSVQVVDLVPTGGNDLPVEWLATGTGIVRCRAPGG